MTKLYLQRTSFKGYLLAIIYFTFFPLSENIAAQIIPGPDELELLSEESLSSEVYNELHSSPSDIFVAASFTGNPTTPELSSNAPVCDGADLQLTATSVSGASYQWTGPAGFSSTEQNPFIPNVNIYNAGTYTLVVEESGNFSTPATIDIIVRELPQLIPTNNAGICMNDLELYSNASGGSGSFTYAWTGPDGFSSTLSNPVINNPDNTNEGTFTLTITDTNGCTNSATTEVSLFDTVPSGSVVNSTSLVCSYSEIVVSTIQTSEPSVSYEWTGPNNTSTSNGDYPDGPIIIIPSAGPNNQGWYGVTISIDGCTTFTSDPFNVGVYAPPGVNLTYQVYGEVDSCVNSANQVVLYSNPYAGTGFFTNFYWHGPDGFTYNTQNLVFDNFSSDLLGNYDVFVIDDNGCESLPDSVTIDFAAAPQLPYFLNQSEYADAICPGTPINLSVENPEGTDISYNWFFNGTPLNNNTNSFSIPNSTSSNSGTYSLSYHIDGCSSDTATIEVSVTNDLIIEVDDVVLECFSSSNSSVNLTANVSGGIGGYTYMWSGPNDFSSADESPLLENIMESDTGLYTLIVNDAFGCSATAVAEITMSIPPETPAIMLTGSDCEGNSLALSSTAYSGTDVSYVWTGPEGAISNNSPTLLLNSTQVDDAGTYTLAVIVDGCTSESGIYDLVIQEQPQVSINTDNIPDLICSDGTVQVDLSASVTGGEAPYSYAWSGPNGFSSTEASPSIMNAMEDDTGNYSVVVVDANGCESDVAQTAATVMIQIGDQLAEPEIASSSSGCVSGDVVLSAQAYPEPNVEYIWTGPNGPITNNTNELTLLAVTPADAGMYTLSVALDGCTSESGAYDLVIQEQPQVSINTDNIPDLICSDGTVQVDLSASVTGGEAPYSYTWSGPNSFSSTEASPSIMNATEDDTGDYSVVVVDANGCESDVAQTAATVMIQIGDQLAEPEIASSSSGCVSGDVVLSVQAYSEPNVEYIWTGPNGPITNYNNELTLPAVTPADAGLYTLSVALDGCTSESGAYDLVIQEQPHVSINTDNIPDLICSDGTVQVDLSASVTGGEAPYSYTWSGPNGFSSTGASPSIMNATEDDTGDYSVVVIDANGCESDVAQTAATVMIQIGDQLAEPEIASSSSGCVSGDVVLSVQAYPEPNVEYIWTGPNGPITNNTNELTLPAVSPADAGMYTLSVALDGCTSEPGVYDLVIQEQPQVSINTDNIPDLICSDGTAQVDLSASVTGGEAPYSYTWSGPNSFSSTESSPSIMNATENDTGDYSVVVIDANGCESNVAQTAATVMIQIGDQLAEPEIASNSSGCVSGDVVLSVQAYPEPNVEYIWTGPNGPITNNTNELTLPAVTPADAGMYTLSVALDGCTSESGTYDLVIQEQPHVSINTDNIPDLICSDGTVQVDLSASVTGGEAPYSYTWSGPNSFSSTEASPSIMNATEEDTGNYSVVVVDANGCESDVAQTAATVMIQIGDQLAEPEIASSSSGCVSGDVVLSVQAYSEPNVEYIWTGPNGPITNNNNELTLPAVTPADAGLYTLSVALDGCTSESGEYDLVIQEQPQVSINTDNIPDLICSDGTVQVDLSASVTGGEAPYSYTWSGPNGFSSTEASPSIMNATDVNAGTYNLVVTDANGCESDPAATTGAVELNIAPPIVQPEIETSGTTCMGTNLMLTVDEYSGTEVNYIWTGPNGLINNNSNELLLQSLNGNDEGTYALIIEVDGCADTSATWLLELYEIPAVTVDNSGVLCASSTGDLLLNANPTGGQAPFTYEWAGPNNFVSNMQNPIISNADISYTGTYTLLMTDANGCSPETVATEVVLSDAPEAPGIGDVNPLCEGDLLQLITDTNYPGNDISYNWYTPNGVINTTEPFLIIDPIDPSYNGAYTLEAVVDGCTSLVSQQVAVEITPTPEAPQLPVDMGVCENQPLVLSTVTIADEYQWEGPNNYTSNQANPTVTNEMSNVETGAYALIVFENGCVSPVSTIYININPQPPTPTLEVNGNFCEGVAIELSTSDYEPGHTYLWVGPDGVDASLNNPLLVTTDATTANSTSIPAGNTAYDAGWWNVIVTDAQGCTSEPSMPDQVNILALPDDPEPTNNGPLCEGETAQLFGGAAINVNYNWYDGDPYASPPGQFISSLNNPELGVLPTGSHAFWLQVEKEGCLSENVIPTEVMVNEAPIVSSVSNTGPFCEGEIIQLNGPEIPGATYAWTGPDNFSSTEQNPQIQSASVLKAGTYTLVVNDGFCASEPGTTQVEVVPAPAIPVVENTGPVCAGGSIELLVSNILPGVNVEYFWEGPAGFTSNLANPSIDNIDTINMGAYTLTIVVDGCISEVSLPTVVEISEIITAADVANNTTENTPVCEGDLVALFAEGIPGATYTWTGPNGFYSNLQNPIIPEASLLDSGAYMLTVIVGNCETVLPEATTVYIQEAPEAPILASVEPACEGSTVTLIIPEIEPWVSYTWYAGSTDLPVGTGAAFLIADLSLTDAGSYYVIASVGGCESEPSELVEVVVNEIPNETAYAGEPFGLCDVFTASLGAFNPTVGTGSWASLNGATVVSPDSDSTIITDLIEGDNTFVWSLSNGSCFNYSTDTVHVFVSTTTNESADAGLDQNLCNQVVANLEATAVSQAEGMWIQESIQSSLGVVIAEPTNPNSAVTGLVPGNTYKFTWTLSNGVCVDFSNDFVLLSVEAASDNLAYAGEDDYHCGESIYLLDAVEPASASGEWTTTSQAGILSPGTSTTEVIDLQEGANQFIWTLSTDNCPGISSDTLVIYSEVDPLANGDTEYIEMNERLDVFDLMLNDVNNAAEIEFSIITPPAFGLLEVLDDGVVSYQPNEDFYGTDEFVYQLCNPYCSELCDTAVATIIVRFEGEENFACFVPSIITPNDDGTNDELVITCLEHFPENELTIFNRLGDKIYEAAPYTNDWGGTFKGSPAPEGSYFYILHLNDEDRTVINGYVIIKR